MREPGDLNLRNTAPAQHPGLDIFRQNLQFAPVGRTGDRDRSNKVDHPKLADDRGFGFLREIINGIDFSFHIRIETVEIATLPHFQHRLAKALHRLAGQFLQVGQTINGVLNAQTDRILDGFRTGAGIRHLYLNPTRFNAGKGFPLQGGDGNCARPQQHQHDEVGCRRMGGKKTDHRGATLSAVRLLSGSS